VVALDNSSGRAIHILEIFSKDGAGGGRDMGGTEDISVPIK